MVVLAIWTCSCCGVIKDGDVEQPRALAQPCNLPLCDECYSGALLDDEVA